MATETISIVVTGDASDLASAASSATSSMDKMGRSAKKLERNLDKTEKQTADLKGAVDGFDKVAQGVGGPLGEMSGRIKSLGEGFAQLGASGGPVLIAGAALTGAAVAAAAVAAGMIAITSAAPEAIARLNGIADVSREQEAAITSANESLSAIGRSFDLLIVTMAAEFAPVVEQISRVLVSMGLAAIDGFKALARGAGLARQWLSEVAFTITKAVAPVLADFFRGLAAVADFLGLDVADKLHSASDGFAKLSKHIQDTNELGFDPLYAITGSYLERADELIGKVKAHASAQRELADATKATAQASGADSGGSGLGIVGQPLDDTGGGFEIPAIDESSDKMQGFYDTMSKGSEIAGIVANTFGMLGDVFDVSSAKSAKAAKKMFFANKAMALGQAIAQTAASVAALINPLVGGLPPLNFIQAGIAGALGAAQIAKIAAEKPPSFHFGGVVGSTGPMGAGSAPGDVVTRLQVGEQVVTQQQRADARSGGGGPVAVLQIGHRTMEAVTMTQTDDPRSTLGKMSLSDNYGHRGFAGAK